MFCYQNDKVQINNIVLKPVPPFYMILFKNCNYNYLKLHQRLQLQAIIAIIHYVTSVVFIIIYPKKLQS